MSWYTLIIVALSVIFCGATCDERAGAGDSPPPPVCLPALTPESDPLPQKEFLAAARNISRGRDENYICQILHGQRVTYLELDQAEVIRRCHGSDRTLGCYAPGIGEHTIYLVRDPPGWAARHEFYHLLLCLGPGLCTENESHTWMGRRGIPGIPQTRKPPD